MRDCSLLGSSRHSTIQLFVVLSLFVHISAVLILFIRKCPGSVSLSRSRQAYPPKICSFKSGARFSCFARWLNTTIPINKATLAQHKTARASGTLVILHAEHADQWRRIDRSGSVLLYSSRWNPAGCTHGTLSKQVTWFSVMCMCCNVRHDMYGIELQVAG